MGPKRVRDWNLLPGKSVEIRHRGVAICSGQVDSVTEDGAILWLQQKGIQGRQLFEKAESYEVWALETTPGDR
jgi:hypothetical protein